MDETIKRNFMNLDINLLQKKFGKNLIINENLSKYSWFNLGGPADIFFRPENLHSKGSQSDPLKSRLNRKRSHGIEQVFPNLAWRTARSD